MKRDKKQEMWVEHLNTICKPVDEYGDRPCDFGCICDRCEHMAISFKEWREMEVNKDGNSERD